MEKLPADIIFAMLHRIGRIADIVSVLFVIILICGSDTPRLNGNETDRTRAYTRDIEFDYPNWILDAMVIKIEQAAISAPYSLQRTEGKQIVREYIRVTSELQQVEASLQQIYADPNIKEKDSASQFLRIQHDDLRNRQNQLAPFTESVLQSQVSEMLVWENLTSLGQPIPPVLYHVSQTPLALIVSPRNKIEQVVNISVLPSLSVDEQNNLEEQIDQSLDVSSLIVEIGGVGVTPTMVTENDNLPWTISTIAHEWTHNYLNFRPLGLHYSTTPELRTMNETTANIVGNEIGHLVLQTYYPEFVASNSDRNLSLTSNPFFLSKNTDDPPPFDFRAEMHETRVKVDELLAEGNIEEAETYMEQRRQIFWEHGYTWIRKLNQAYFAFHGAYADVPGGAAGEDPVGPAVRTLREQSASLKDFINTIAKMTSFEELQEAIDQ